MNEEKTTMHFLYSALDFMLQLHSAQLGNLKEEHSVLRPRKSWRKWSHYLLPFPFEKSDVVLVSFLSRIWRRKHLHFIWQEHSKLSHKLSFKLLLKIILLRQQRKSHINSIYSNYLDKWCRECRRKIPWPGFYVEETFYINKCGRCYPPSSRLVRANQHSIGQCHCSQLWMLFSRSKYTFSHVPRAR